MFKNYQPRQTLLAALIALSLPLNYSLPVVAETESVAPNTLARLETETIDRYQLAEAELPKDFYVIYRIVDRLTRANNLDIPYWRVTFEQEYVVNAYAYTAYLIVLNQGILDLTEGDTSALAFIIAHEMGHHLNQHYSKMYEKAQEYQSLWEEVMSASEVDPSAQEKLKYLEEDLKQQSKTYELEADKVGYLYAVRAGFEPEGGIRALKLFEQVPGATGESDTHPDTAKRIEALQALIKEHPTASLESEGESSLGLSKALTYQFAPEKQSLRVNTQAITSSVDDLNRLFGQ